MRRVERKDDARSAQYSIEDGVAGPARRFWLWLRWLWEIPRVGCGECDDQTYTLGRYRARPKPITSSA